MTFHDLSTLIKGMFLQLPTVNQTLIANEMTKPVTSNKKK